MSYFSIEMDNEMIALILNFQLINIKQGLFFSFNKRRLLYSVLFLLKKNNNCAIVQNSKPIEK